MEIHGMGFVEEGSRLALARQFLSPSPAGFQFTSSPSSSRQPSPTVATRSLQPRSPYSAVPQAGAG